MELIELDYGEVGTAIDAVDLNSLLEKMGEPSSQAYASIRLNYLCEDRDGDTKHQLIVKKKRDYLLFIKKVIFTHCNDQDLDSADTDAFYLEEERALSLYNLLVKELEKISEFYDEEPYVGDNTYVTTKDSDNEWADESDPMFTTPVIMAIFKEFVKMVEKEHGDTYGADTTYDILTSSITSWLVD